MNSTRTKATLVLAAGIIVAGAAALPALGTSGSQVVTVQLRPVNGMHQSGTATLTPTKTGFIVLLRAKGAGLHDNQEPYIHNMTCERYTHLIPRPFNPTDAQLQKELVTVTNDLTPIVNGRSKTFVPQPLKSVTTGGFSIVLNAWNWAGTAAACGTVPKQ